MMNDTIMNKKIYCCIIACLLLSVAAIAQRPGYDSVLAKKVGADDYGMKQYVLVILTTGPSAIAEKQTVDSLFKGHMANMDLLAKDGRLVVAGPFGKNDLKYRGLFIMNTGSVEDAKAWVATDPAVKAGLLDAVYVKWYGSAALMETNAIHDKVQKKNF